MKITEKKIIEALTAEQSKPSAYKLTLTADKMKEILAQYTSYVTDDVISWLRFILADVCQRAPEAETEENFHRFAATICKNLEFPPPNIGKITPYPKKDTPVSIPILSALKLDTNNVISDNGDRVELDEHQYKLISAIRVMLDRNDKEGDGQHLFTLDSIVRYFRGNSSIDPTDAERKQVANMLDFFQKTPVYVVNEQGQRAVFHFVHLDYVENAVMNGEVTNVYKIHAVVSINHTHNIYFYQLGLPKGYANNLENSTLWAEIIEKQRDGASHVIDFELICAKLGVSKRDHKKRNLLYNKLNEMVCYYGFQEVLRVQRYHYGTLIEEKIIEKQTKE